MHHTARGYPALSSFIHAFMHSSSHSFKSALWNLLFEDACLLRCQSPIPETCAILLQWRKKQPNNNKKRRQWGKNKEKRSNSTSKGRRGFFQLKNSGVIQSIAVHIQCFSVSMQRQHCIGELVSMGTDDVRALLLPAEQKSHTDVYSNVANIS